MDRDGIRQTVAAFRPDLVIHLAARTVLDERTTSAYYAANIAGVQNLIDAVQAAGTVERTFFVLSRLCLPGSAMKPKDDVDYQPSTLYGLSKVRGELPVCSSPASLGTPTIRDRQGFGLVRRAISSLLRGDQPRSIHASGPPGRSEVLTGDVEYRASATTAGLASPV